MYNFLASIFAFFIPQKKLRKKCRNALIKMQFLSLFKNKHIIDYGQNNMFLLYQENGNIIKNPKIEGLTVIFYGNNNIVELHEPLGIFKNCCFEMRENSKIIIDSFYRSICNLKVTYGIFNSILKIGKNFSCVGVEIQMHDEPNCNITIGDNCLFSFGILMRPSDGHTVYDLNTKKIYNRAAGGVL